MRDRWGIRGGWLGGEKTSSRESGICGSALLCGFSLNEYRPLRLEVFFSSFPIRQKRILLPSGPQGWRGPIPYAKSFVFVGGLCSAAIFRTIYLTLTLGPTSMCATCADPDWCRCPSGLVCPVGAAFQFFTTVCSLGPQCAWVCKRYLSLPFFLPNLALPFSQIHTRSFRCPESVCMLSREFFVEL